MGGKVAAKGGVKKERKAKDPNAPKRPLSSYMLFCQEKREEVKSKNKDAKATEISKILGEMWSKVSDSEKKNQDMQEKAKARYEKEKEAYEKKHKDDDDDEKDDDDEEEEEEEKPKKSAKKSKKHDD